jgi:serine/threonine protein kinase
LHRQGVIHRDIAARNVLLAGKRDLIAKVADFGMSRLLSESVYDEQTTLNAVGPLKWMAPEQMERRAYSRASDVFAFGVLLYEIFQREVPWQGVSNIMTATKCAMASAWTCRRARFRAKWRRSCSSAGRTSRRSVRR